MNRKISIVGVVLVLVVIGGWISYREPAKNDSPITIGFVGPLTGAPALWGEGAKNTVAMAVDEINANGGINSRKIVVKYEDSKCSPKDAVSSTQKLVSEGVKIIIGGHCSPETVAMAPLSKNGEFFMIAGVTSSDNAVASSRYAFRTSPATSLIAEKVAALTFKKYKRMATLTEETAFGRSYTDDFTKSYTDLGGSVVAAESFAPNTNDLRSEITKIVSQHPEAILLSPQSPATALQIIRQMEDLGVKIPIAGSSVALSKDVYEKSGHSKLLAGAFTVIPYINAEDPVVARIVNLYKEKYGTDVPYNLFYVLSSYDAVKMTAKAMDKCGEDPKSIADEFRTMEYKGVAGEYTFLENGDSSFARFAKYSIDENGEHFEEIR